MANKFPVNQEIAKLSKGDFQRDLLEDLMKRRFIIAPAFQIYRGVAGLYDYGPVGCAIKANLIALWRQHFVLTEDMLEVDCTALTLEAVLKTSGHVDKFNDFMVKDVKNGNCFRADHLLEAHVDKLMENPKLDEAANNELKLVRARAGDMTKEELTAAFKKYQIKAPETNNDLEDPFQFNLMFGTSIGPTGQLKGYLRPETAQGIFVNFKRLLEYNGGRLPFAAAQIGNAYRNEIAPRSGLLRVREFTMAEIEHFVHPEHKQTPKFKSVADLKVNLLSSKAQSTTGDIVSVTLGEAVAAGMIANETLGYFLGRTQLFLVAAGVHADKLRFRQHQQNEMAHYANDCWDAEIFSSYGWVECVGHADRGCFDLTRHSEESGIPLHYYEEFKEGPRMTQVMKPTINKQLVGKTFKGDQKDVVAYLEALSLDDAKSLQAQLEKESKADVDVKGKKQHLTKEMVSFNEVTEKSSGVNITPHVIEPSFGLGRIIYSILEHAYRLRPEEAGKQDEGGVKRAFLSLPPIIAPTKVSVLPLITDDKYVPVTRRVAALLKENGLSNKVDDTGVAIGRRYARTDEIGVPFGITIDSVTLEDDTVTVRERDTMKQIRVKIDEVGRLLRQLCDNTTTWEQVVKAYPAYSSNSNA